ncbi:hypothetical protein BV210_01960 [Halorientalis sp. IM1011]|uniref:hypothetical protein n=1 Tax=Halorientalis sp. IM1011 TaxID=1932360 RepID=UPI00097CC63A|nr:hypothetical protein [Halorientalis sp. IM1011]AQL41553.1 hypothetical protein BV210_01960 [Halorientalis sp. IM1011]
MSGAGLAPGTGATAVDGEAVSVQSDSLDAMTAVDSYRAVTNMDVSIGANRTFTNVTTVVNRSTATASVYSTDGNDTTHVVDDRIYRNGSDGWQVESTGAENVTRPAREQIELLNDSRVTDVQRTRTNGRQTYQLELTPNNTTVAETVAAQPGNGIERAASMTVLDRSYDIVVNRSTHRVQRVQMTLKFQHDGEIGRATMVTWFSGYNETVPAAPERVPSEN